MSKVRVLVGTRKGAFILTSDGKREKVGGQRSALCRMGAVSPQGIAGRSQSHLCIADQRMVRAIDPALRRWRQDLAPAGNASRGAVPPGPQRREQQVCLRSLATGKPLTTHQWYDGTQHPWEFKRVWHLEPSLTDPNTVYAGVEDAAIFRSTDGGQNWKELSGLRGHGTGPNGSRARAACACTRSFSIPAIRSECTLRFRPRAHSAPTMAARPGSRSIADCVSNTFLTRTLKSATACTTSP